MKSKYFFSAALPILMLCISLTALAAPPPKPPTLEQRVVQLEALVANLQTQLAANTAADDATQLELAATTAALAENTTLDDATQLALAETNLDLAETNELLATNTAADTADHSKLAGVTRSPNTILFSGMNVQVVSGSGTTNGAINGTGNVIIGYNEFRGAGQDFRTGSHMLVIGVGNNYTQFGGMVVGRYNTASGSYASVSGGFDNTASGLYSSVSGGYTNTASGDYSSVSGGQYNTASGQYSSVSGGGLNTASGLSSSVSGGLYNTAIGNYSSVSGGNAHTAAGIYDWVAGSLFQDQ